MSSSVDGNGHSAPIRVSWRFTHIAAGTATTVVKAAPGKLHAIVINTSGASSNTIAVYDDASGTSNQIALIDGTTDEKTLFYDAECVEGISIVSAAGTGADMTVLWV